MYKSKNAQNIVVMPGEKFRHPTRPASAVAVQADDAQLQGGAG